VSPPRRTGAGTLDTEAMGQPRRLKVGESRAPGVTTTERDQAGRQCAELSPFMGTTGRASRRETRPRAG